MNFNNLNFEISNRFYDKFSVPKVHLIFSKAGEKAIRQIGDRYQVLKYHREKYQETLTGYVKGASYMNDYTLLYRLRL